MKEPLKTLAVNPNGRDFVIGDLHGSYSVFENLMKGINFNYDTDRMISVCDLVDRGPESLKCLGLLRQPWFHSVLANHEQMMLQKFYGGDYGNYWYRNGGVWGMMAYNEYKEKTLIPSDSSADLFDLLPRVNELPYLITVNMKSGKKYHVLHAEMPYNAGVITDQRLEDPEEVRKLATMERGDGESFLWNRNLFYEMYGANLGNTEQNAKMADRTGATIFNDKLSHIISGHSVVQHPVTIIGQTNIDTGAYRSYTYPATSGYTAATIVPPEWAGLTCVELDTWKFYKATETTFVDETPVVITQADIDLYSK